MMRFPVGAEHALDAPVQRQHHADAREHRITVALGDQLHGSDGRRGCHRGRGSLPVGTRRCPRPRGRHVLRTSQRSAITVSIGPCFVEPIPRCVGPSKRYIRPRDRDRRDAGPDSGRRRRSLARRRNGTHRGRLMTTLLETGLASTKLRSAKTTMRDGHNRPIVVVTGMGVITSLGEGKTENWAKLTAGESGIGTIRRFSTHGLKTRIGGSIDFVEVKPFSSTTLSDRLAYIVLVMAVGLSRIGRIGDVLS